MIASHHVISDLLEAWDDSEYFLRLLQKYLGRYPDDIDLRELNRVYSETIEKKELGRLPQIRLRLEEMYQVRKLESGGSIRTSQKDYRHLSDDRHFRINKGEKKEEQEKEEKGA
jgi:hypothetical protein